MKRLFFILAAFLIVSEMLAEKIGDLSYYLDSATYTARVTSSNVKGDIIIPETVEYKENTYTVTSIGNSAFSSCSGLPSVEIPNSVISIGNFAFYNCSGLISVEIPNSVIIIGNNAFEECSSLKIMAIMESADSLYINGNIGNAPIEILNLGRDLFVGKTTIEDKVYDGKPSFANSPSLTTINFGQYVTTIPQKMFSDCINLRSLTIPRNITSIEDNAFNGCLGLKSVNIEDNEDLILIESSTTPAGTGTTFGGAPIETIYLGRNVEYVGSELSPFKNLETLTTLTKGNKATGINNYLFYGCKNIEMLAVPSSVLYIGDYAFYDCNNARLLSISKSVESIGICSFYNCKSLTTLKIPDSVETIGDYAFRSCSNLSDISIGDGVKIIGNYAFLDCYGATQISLGENVEEIGNNAFYNCQSLKEIHIPNSVKNIGNNAFALCGSSTFLKIGLNVESIGNMAFADCENLSVVECYAYEPPIAYDDTFTNYDATLKVPTGSESLYQQSECWENFYDIIPELPDAGVDTILDHLDKEFSVYSIGGILIKKNCRVEDLKSFTKGIYILNLGKERYKVSI